MNNLMNTDDNSLKGYKVATFTDFGQGRRCVIGRHKTIATAMRQYPRLWDIYGRPNSDKGHKVWQEMITANTVTTR